MMKSQWESSGRFDIDSARRGSRRATRPRSRTGLSILFANPWSESRVLCRSNRLRGVCHSYLADIITETYLGAAGRADGLGLLLLGRSRGSGFVL